ncbi:hypothetical protein BCV71DRAFT_239408 [Rhizopus microsporus]|uniref:Uncharacterized protein n=1 Tax=Rhizopus microsporus TaxID=58291 RepID=A0A1X0RMR9_RHIZD|nr:hypothetical protein BCV71DRAFT_239408 [Rhizopus microsporus]
MSTTTKYWSPILESYFVLDLYMVAGTERGPVEAAIGDFASDKATKRKLYHDKLKSVLASKCHLNALIEKLNFLSAVLLDKECNSQEVNLIAFYNNKAEYDISILQVMEQNISLYILFSIDKQVYAVQNEIDAEYPRNIRKVRDGSIAKILNLFGHVAYFIESIEEDIRTIPVIQVCI